MTNSENSPVLTFNGEKYNINTLPEKVKDLLKAAKVADNQIKIQEDNLKLINSPEILKPWKLILKEWKFLFILKYTRLTYIN